MPARIRTALARGLAAALGVTFALLGPMTAANADAYVPISGSGSTWSFNALDQWRKDVDQYGMRINFSADGSSAGRNAFAQGTVDFAVSEIEYGLKDGGVVEYPPKRNYAYMPIVAGGTSFMYNLKIAGKRVRDLRLSGETVAKIFTGVVTIWSDPAIKADNPGLALPARRIVPVVRSDGSGTTAQLTRYLAAEQQPLWSAYCARAHIPTPCGLTSNFPVIPGTGFTSAGGSLGVSSYVAQEQNEGTITYVEYSYARNLDFPVAKLLNKAGYYTLPTAQNVAVALSQARINDDVHSPSYLTQILDGVFHNPDPRTYPLSSYSYMIIPTAVEGPMTNDKGKTLGAFAYYFLCQGQQTMGELGYSPLPVNLAKAGLEQVKRIPGVDIQSIDITKCNNPTFSADGTNTLAKTAPQPAGCDRQGVTQCVGGASAGGAQADNGAGTGTAAGTGAGTGPGVTGPAGTPGTPGSTRTPSTSGTDGAPNAAGTTPEPDSQPVVAGGQPVSGDALGGAPGSPGSAAVAQAVPVAVVADNSFSNARGMVAIAVLLLIALLVAPPALSRAISRRESQ